MESLDKVFKLPFSFAYWREAASEFKNTKKIAIASILVAMTIILETIGNLTPFTFFDRKVFFSFIPVVLSAMICGPLMSLTTGFVADILGFFVSSAFSPIAFFPGYTLSAMLGALIYSLFLYRTNISILRIFLSKLIVNLFVNAFLGALWLTITTDGRTFLVWFTGGLIKNLICLPLEVYCLMLILQKLIPITKIYGLLSEQIDDRIKII